VGSQSVSQMGGKSKDESRERGRELFAQHKNEFSFRVLPVGPLWGWQDTAIAIVTSFGTWAWVFLGKQAYKLSYNLLSSGCWLLCYLNESSWFSDKSSDMWQLVVILSGRLTLDFRGFPFAAIISSIFATDFKGSTMAKERKENYDWFRGNWS